jgi:hypothetical protein
LLLISFLPSFLFLSLEHSSLFKKKQKQKRIKLKIKYI